MGAEGGERSMGRVAAGGVEIPPPSSPPPLSKPFGSSVRAGSGGGWGAQHRGSVGLWDGAVGGGEERGEEGIIMAAGAGRRLAPLPPTYVPVQERPHVPTWDDVPRPTVE